MNAVVRGDVKRTVNESGQADRRCGRCRAPLPQPALCGAQCSGGGEHGLFREDGSTRRPYEDHGGRRNALGHGDHPGPDQGTCVHIHQVDRGSAPGVGDGRGLPADKRQQTRSARSPPGNGTLHFRAAEVNGRPLGSLNGQPDHWVTGPNKVLRVRTGALTGAGSPAADNAFTATWRHG